MTPAVCYRPDAHPCAVCGEPSDVLWHRNRGGLDPHAPGVCQTCAANAVLAFLVDAGSDPAAGARRLLGEGREP